MEDELGTYFQCIGCDRVFQVVWCNDGETKTVEFCPFCGDDARQKEDKP
jgi:rRNA maturation endonuclease Nob1